MFRNIGLIASGALLLLGSLAMPVAAQEDAWVRFLNAVPDKRIDLCVVGVGEVVSGLRFGRASDPQDAGPGNWTVQARVATKGTCKGAKLATRQVVIEPDANYSVVVWRPKDAVAIKVFKNDVALPEAGAVTLVMRHMARAGTIDAWVWKHVRPAADDYFVPTFDDLAKARSSSKVVLSEGQVLIEAFPSAKSAPWDYEFLWQYIFAGGAYEAYLIGTGRSNYQVVLLGQVGTPPGP
jgi:hypothetical protein